MRSTLRGVIFSEPISYFKLPEYYSGADCLCVPSYPDPSPKVVYEGQACKCPIVATNGGGIPEIFGEHSGLLFAPRDVKDLARKIRIVLENKHQFRGGREIVLENAVWTKSVNNIIEYYEEILNKSV